MDIKGHNRDNIPYYSYDTWGIGELLWGVSGAHHQTPAYLEVWVGLGMSLVYSYRRGKDVALITSRYFILLISADSLQRRQVLLCGMGRLVLKRK